MLPPIGPILGNRKPISDGDKAKFMQIPRPTLVKFVGLLESVGRIRTDTSGKNIITELVLILPLSDLALAHYLHDALGGLGRVNVSKGQVWFSIGKTQLQEVLFPLLKHHDIFFITLSMRQQYARAIHVMENGLSKSDTLAMYQAPVLADYDVHFFAFVNFLSDWISGYITGLGAFYIDEAGRHMFSISYRPHDVMYSMFSFYFHAVPRESLPYAAMYSHPELSKYIPDFTVGSDVGRARITGFLFRHPLLKGRVSTQFQAWVESLTRR